MSEAVRPFPVIREAVASFSDREHFRHAVSALLAGGFARDDLSVLASHDSLAVADGAAGTPTEALRTGLSDEIKYIAPLTVAGIIVLSGGPIALTVAARGHGHARELRRLLRGYGLRRARCRGPGSAPTAVPRRP